MFKIKHERTADCVVAGYRVHKSRRRTRSARCCSGSTRTTARSPRSASSARSRWPARAALFTELQPLVTDFDGHPWNWAAHAGQATRTRRAGTRARAGTPGKDLSFVPLRPERVVEVRYDHMEGDRFRHTAQFNRWRPDRTPESCTYDQLEQPVTFALTTSSLGFSPPKTERYQPRLRGGCSSQGDECRVRPSCACPRPALPGGSPHER